MGDPFSLTAGWVFLKWSQQLHKARTFEAISFRGTLRNLEVMLLMGSSSWMEQLRDCNREGRREGKVSYTNLSESERKGYKINMKSRNRISIPSLKDKDGKMDFSKRKKNCIFKENVRWNGR